MAEAPSRAAAAVGAGRVGIRVRWKVRCKREMRAACWSCVDAVYGVVRDVVSAVFLKTELQRALHGTSAVH